MDSPVRIFCSYARKDAEFRVELEQHLTVLQRQGVIDYWYDRLILPGADRDKQIEANLDSAAIVLLLISSDFLASNYCYEYEMKRAISLSWPKSFAIYAI